jgi:hypothetical protein
MCEWADAKGMVALPHYSPGYSGWNIADQCRLFDTIVSGRQSAFPGPLSVFDTGMLNPRKSLITVFGVTCHVDRVDPGARRVPCESCSLPACQFRRAPYKYISGARGTRIDRPSFFEAPGRPLTENATYSFKERVLRKWSKERLRLTQLEDNSIEARFQYEGTTCSNMGRPLRFDYQINLSPASEGYVVREARCEPSSGDEGHKLMCAYISAPDRFTEILSTERPLIGKRLDDVLEWKREDKSAGCYCTRGSRNHKWGIVLEVLHFALANAVE